MHHNDDEIYTKLVQKTRCILETLVSADVCCAPWKLSALRAKPTGDRTEKFLLQRTFNLFLTYSFMYYLIFLCCIKSLESVLIFSCCCSSCLVFFPQRTPISHKVIEKRRRDRINRCLNELGKTVPMALAKQVLWILSCFSCMANVVFFFIIIYFLPQQVYNEPWERIS